MQLDSLFLVPLNKSALLGHLEYIKQEKISQMEEVKNNRNVIQRKNTISRFFTSLHLTLLCVDRTTSGNTPKIVLNKQIILQSQTKKSNYKTKKSK